MKKMIEDITKAYKEAETGLVRFNKYIARLKKYTNLLDADNLKCYDVAYQLEEDQEDVRLFELFCQCEFENLEEYLEEDFFKVVYPIGRTSSFRWIDTDLESFNEYMNEYHLLNPYLSGIDCDFKLYDDLGDYIGYIEDQDDDNKKWAYEEGVAVLQELTFDSLMRHFKEHYSLGIKGYRYVRDFKANQVSIFSGYKEQ